MTEIALRAATLTLCLTLSATSFSATQPAANQQADAIAPREPIKLPSRPNPDASGIYHVGDGVTAPTLIDSNEPEFSVKARKRKISGSVLVKLIVETDGTVRDAHVAKSAADRFTKNKDREAALTLDQNAVEVVRRYRFAPGAFQGRPVPVELNVEINYQIYAK